MEKNAHAVVLIAAVITNSLIKTFRNWQMWRDICGVYQQKIENKAYVKVY